MLLRSCTIEPSYGSIWFEILRRWFENLHSSVGPDNDPDSIKNKIKIISKHGVYVK